MKQINFRKSFGYYFLNLVLDDLKKRYSAPNIKKKMWID